MIENLLNVGIGLIIVYLIVFLIVLGFAISVFVFVFKQIKKIFKEFDDDIRG